MFGSLKELACQAKFTAIANEAPSLRWPTMEAIVLPSRGGHRIYERGGGGGGGGGGGHYILNAAGGSAFSPSFFTSQDGLLWHLRALHCFPDVRGLQVPGPP